MVINLYFLKLIFQMKLECSLFVFLFFGIQSDFLFINSINGYKILLYISNIIVKSSLFDENIQLICKNSYLNINVSQNYTNNFAFFIWVSSIKYIYLCLTNNKTLYDIKSDISQIGNFIIVLFDFLFIKLVHSFVLNSVSNK